MSIGVVANAAPATVLPYSLCVAFRRSQEFLTLDNEYQDGEFQRNSLVSVSRKVWELGKRLTAAQLATLRQFFIDRKGSTEPFYFYDVWETSAFSYDATGVSTTGRYTVRFDGAFDQTVSIPRSEVQIRLVELA